jgi:hypothetical protein
MTGVRERADSRAAPDTGVDMLARGRPHDVDALGGLKGAGGRACPALSPAPVVTRLGEQARDPWTGGRVGAVMRARPFIARPAPEANPSRSRAPSNRGSALPPRLPAALRVPRRARGSVRRPRNDEPARACATRPGGTSLDDSAGSSPVRRAAQAAPGVRYRCWRSGCRAAPGGLAAG